MRFAFYGGTAEYGAEVALRRQRELCEAAIGTTGEITAVFFDTEPPAYSDRPQTTPLERDGGSAELIAEAARPDRRFEAVVVPSADWLSRSICGLVEFARTLVAEDLPMLIADWSENADGGWLNRTCMSSEGPAQGAPECAGNPRESDAC